MSTNPRDFHTKPRVEPIILSAIKRPNHFKTTLNTTFMQNLISRVNNKPSSVINARINDESGLNYEQRRNIDLVQQVLNGRLNVLQEFRNVSDLFRIYGNVLRDRLPPDFNTSLKTSEKALFNFDYQREAVSNLKSNNPNSFLIVPISSYGHMFAANIRKRGDEFAVTVVNKGARGHRQQFEEYNMKEENVNKILEAIILKTDYKIEQIYQAFDRYSNSHHTLGIQNTNQKVGNCFIKEPENAIKFAVATRNLSNEDFEKIRFNMFDFNRKNFKVKWDISTAEIHGQFVKEVMRENPAIAPMLASEFKTYAENKQFREMLQANTDLVESLSSAYDPKGDTYNMESPDRLKKLLSHINYDTLMQNGGEIRRLAQSTQDSDYFDIYNRTRYYAENSKNFFSEFAGIENLFNLPKLFNLNPVPSLEEKIKQNLDLTEPYFPNVVNQVKLDYHSAFFMSGTSLAMKGRFDEALNKLNVSIDLYPHHSMPYAFRGIIHSEMGNGQMAVEDIRHALALNPDDPLANQLIKELSKNTNNSKHLFSKHSRQIQNYIRFSLVPDVEKRHGNNKSEQINELRDKMLHKGKETVKNLTLDAM